MYLNYGTQVNTNSKKRNPTQKSPKHSKSMILTKSIIIVYHTVQFL